MHYISKYPPNKLKKTPNLTCGVLLFLSQYIVVIHIFLLFSLFCFPRVVLHRDHSKVGGHFHTMCFLPIPPVCHTLISLPFLLPLCSAVPLSLSLSLFLRPTAVTLFLFLALLLSRLLFCSHLPPWCAAPPGKTSDLSSQFLVLSLGFCCTPM